jgi:DNA primase
MISPEEIEKVKYASDIFEVVSRFVLLKKRGRNYLGLCPFHQEKSPSFTVSPDKQIWHCFGCGKGGDVFSFLQEMEGLDFPEALKLLAERAGVKLDTFVSEIKQSQRNRLFEITKKAGGTICRSQRT